MSMLPNQPSGDLLQPAKAAMAGGNWASAVSILQQIHEQNPTASVIFRYLSVCYCRLGRWTEALATLRQALEAEGNDAGLWELLGIALLKTSQAVDAEACFRRAIAIKPNASLHSNLGAALLELGRFAESTDESRRALVLLPGDLAARHNLAKALIKLDRPGEAVREIEIVIQQRPNYHEYWFSLGIARQAQARHEEAIVALRRSLDLQPNVRVQSHLIFAMHEAGRDPQAILSEARRWDQIYLAPPMPHFENTRDAMRVLRIGYVSGDLKGHPVATFLAPILAAHNADAVEAYCYSYVTHPDGVTQALKSRARIWRDISRLTDEAAAELIRADRIDVLVDLSGHCPGNRLGILARHAAPIQMTYLGYPGTTGLQSIQYRLTDSRLDPPGKTEQFCSETLLRLDHVFAVYEPPNAAPSPSALPMEKAGFFRFASFGARPKIGDHVLRTWARILARVEGSCLDLVGFDPSELDAVRQIFGECGVHADRITFHPRLSFSDYFAAHHRVDLLLDTFPLSGHTVVCHGLWMGIPSVCLRGRIYWERLAASTMDGIGMPELVARDVDEYVEIAVRLARDSDTLKKWRESMRQRMQESALMDYEGHTQRLESVMRSAWNDWVRLNNPA